MPEGVFPPFVETGKCSQKRCMKGMYACTPKHYVVKVLRRLDRRCHPLPLTGLDVRYEHAWGFVDYSVIVGCECSKRRRLPPGLYAANSAGELIEIV